MNPDPCVFIASVQNPIVRALAIVVGAGVLVAMFALGLMFFAVFAGIALVSGLVLAARLWWLNRKLGKADAAGAPLEGEYRIVSETRSVTRDANKR